MKLYLLSRGTWPICPCWWRHLLWQVCSRSCSRSVDISHAGLGHIGRRTEAGRSVRNILSMSKTTSDFRFRVHYSLINWNTSNHLNLRPFTLPYHEDSEHLVVMPGTDWRHSLMSWRLLSSRAWWRDDALQCTVTPLDVHWRKYSFLYNFVQAFITAST